jgi:hypothetical protein
VRKVSGARCGVEVEKHLDILSGAREALVQTVDGVGLLLGERNTGFGMVEQTRSCDM